MRAKPAAVDIQIPARNLFDSLALSSALANRTSLRTKSAKSEITSANARGRTDPLRPLLSCNSPARRRLTRLLVLVQRARPSRWSALKGSQSKKARERS